MLKPLNYTIEVGMSLACFYPMEPEFAVHKAASLGMRVCEIFLNTYSELDDAYLHKLRLLCDQKGLRVYSIHPFTSALEHYMFFSPYPRRVADSLSFYERYARAAKILGAEVINIHGDRGLGVQRMDEYVQCVLPLMQLQDKTGVMFSLENVYYNSVNDPKFVSELKKRIPEARFTLDIKQACKGGQNPYRLAEAMGESLVNFHVNDRTDEAVCLLPGFGSIDYDKLDHILKTIKYTGPALIEVYSDNFQSLDDISRSKKFLEEKFSLAN